MYKPDYSITSKILNNIGRIEYSKAVLDNTIILHNWETQLLRETRVDIVYSEVCKLGISIDLVDTKKALDTISDHNPLELLNINETLDQVSEISKNREWDEVDLKYIHKTLTKGIVPKAKQGIYRNAKIAHKPTPETILAEIVETFDWLNSLETQQLHPIIVAGILKYRIDEIQPFDDLNSTVGDMASLLALRVSNYKLRDFVNVLNIQNDSETLTEWLEEFSGAIADESYNTQEKVKLLSKDAKVAKASGMALLSARQERIVEFIHDYGMIQNKDFYKLFPNKSEDSILRDLKVLLDKKIIKKTGSTKSSRYELV